MQKKIVDQIVDMERNNSKMSNMSFFENLEREKASNSLKTNPAEALMTAIGGRDTSIKDTVISELSKAGYNALWDTHDTKGGISRAPLIIFDAPISKVGIRDDSTVGKPKFEYVGAGAYLY